MIIRKYPEADLESKRNLFFSAGLVVTMLLVVTAFEWKFYDDGHLVELSANTDIFEEVLDIPPTEQPPPPPPKAQARNLVILEIPDEEIQEEIKIDLDVDVTEDMAMEVEYIAVEEDEEVVEEIFTIVETYPQPQGGYEEFYKFVFERIEYPKVALRAGIEGKVFVQFVVEKDGSMSDFVVAKGIGAGCDEEAVRVLKMAPNWSPGKQRGKPVRVRMILPIKFEILF